MQERISEVLFDRSLKRQLIFLFLIVPLYFAVSYAVAIVLRLLVFLLGLIVPSLRAFLSGDVGTELLQLFVYLGGLLIPALIYRKSQNIPAACSASLGLVPFGGLLTMLVSGMALCFVSGGVGGLFSTLLESLFGFQDPSQMELPGSVGGILLLFVQSVLLPPVVEEYVFRGVVLQSLRKYGNGFAIVLSAALFAMMHGSFAQMIATFLMGLVFGYMAVKSESLLPTILLHFLNNGIAFAELVLQKILPENSFTLIVYGLELVVILLGWIVGFCYIKKHPNVLTLQTTAPVLPCEKYKKAVLQLPLFWVAIALGLVNIIISGLILA